MKKSAAPDWEAIERAYRAGAGSVRAIAEAHGTKAATICSRAKSRDGYETLQSRYAARLGRKFHATSRTDFTQPDVREDAQVVADESDKRAGVVVGQIGRLATWAEIAGKSRQSLSETVVTADNQAEFARSLNAGVDAELKLIKAERQAYGIDESNGEEPYEERLARLLEGQPK